MISYNFLASPGQLANQMFKYAALKGLANNLGEEFMIPKSYEILRYKFPLKVANKLKIIDHKSNQNHLLFKNFKMGTVKNTGYQNTDIFIKEKGFEFDKELFNCKDSNFDIWGFFQSEKYFIEIRNEILEDFQFKNNISKKTKKIFEQFNDPVSLHVRRGDYVTQPDWNPLSLTYYEKSLNYFDKNQQIVIFSDDVSWCKEQNIFKNPNFIFADQYTKSEDTLDLSLMTMCKYHIIANSSFSWWGAWLSTQEKVFAPKDWFKGSKKYSHYNTKDLLPEKWIKIEN